MSGNTYSVTQTTGILPHTDVKTSHLVNTQLWTAFITIQC